MIGRGSGPVPGCKGDRSEEGQESAEVENSKEELLLSRHFDVLRIDCFRKGSECS